MLLTKYLMVIHVDETSAVLVNTLNGKQFVIKDKEIELIERWRKNDINVSEADEIDFLSDLQKNGFIFSSENEEKIKEEVMEDCRQRHEKN